MRIKNSYTFRSFFTFLSATSSAIFLMLFVNISCKYMQPAKIKTTEYVGNINDGIELQSEINEYKITNNSTVFFVDMVHVAERSFYEEIGNFFGLKSKEKDESKVRILWEGYTCSNSTYYVSNPDAFDKKWMKDWQKSSLSKFFSDTTVAEMTSGKSPFLTFEPCRSEALLDSAKIAIELQEREEDFSKNALVGQASQMDRMTQGFPRNINRSADVDFSKTSKSTQISMALYVFNKLVPKKSGNIWQLLNPTKGKSLSNWMQSSEGENFPTRVRKDILIEVRNEYLMSALKRAVAEGVETLLLPWGAAHNADFESRLKIEFPEFKRVNTQKIRVGTCLEKGKVDLKTLKVGLTEFGGLLCSEKVVELVQKSLEAP